jgi:hypothetical protein
LALTRNCLEIKLKALSRRAFVQLGKSSTHTSMNEGSARLDDDEEVAAGSKHGLGEVDEEYRPCAPNRLVAQYLVDHIFVYPEAKICSTSSAVAKSRDIASRASVSIAAEESGISVVRSLPWCRLVIANLPHFLLLTSAVWRLEPLGEIILSLSM